MHRRAPGRQHSLTLPWSRSIISRLQSLDPTDPRPEFGRVGSVDANQKFGKRIEESVAVH